MSEHRFTNKEVALILRRTVELEEKMKSPPADRGLTIEDIQEIAREVGLAPELLSQAIHDLQSRGSFESRMILGPSSIKREIRAVPSELTQDQLKELISIVDQEVLAQGTVSEALGTVRWNARDRFLSTQVSLEPGNGETVIKVEERIKDRLKYMLHFIPGAYAAFFAGMAGLQAGTGIFPAILLGIGGAVSGGALGGGVWRILSGRSTRRVRSLVDKLSARVTRDQREKIQESPRHD